MTARVMQQVFQQHIEAALGYGLPRITSDDIANFLNEAQREMFDTRFNRYEVDQKITDDLSPFVTKQTVINAEYTTPTYDAVAAGYYVDVAPFPATYRHLLDSRIQVFVANSGNFDFEIVAVPPDHREPNSATPYTDYTTQSAKPRLAQHDDINTLMSDPFHKSLSTEPLVTISQTGLDVYTDLTFITDKVVIDYLANPTEIDITQGTDSIFPAFLHRELVELAVSKYLRFATNNINTVTE